jgi:hypothetical protein
MKNYIRHHINVVIIALRVILFAAAVVCLYNLFRAFGFIEENDSAVINEFLLNYFTPIVKTYPKDMQLLGARSFFNIKWLAIGFMIAYTALIIYGMNGIVRLYKCLLRIEKGQLFYNEQGEQLRKVGATVIIFAKIKYVLFCFVGIMSFLDISTFIKQLPELLAVYLIGKLILIMSYIAEKGEFIKEENELTI